MLKIEQTLQPEKNSNHTNSRHNYQTNFALLSKSSYICTLV